MHFWVWEKRCSRHQRILFFSLLFLLAISGCYSKTLNGPRTWQQMAHDPPGADGDYKILHLKLDYPSATFMYEKDDVQSGSISSVPTADELIPEYNKIIVIIKPEKRKPSEEVISVICEAISRVVPIAASRIKVSKYEPSTGVMKIYFVKPIAKRGDHLVLSSVADIIPKLSVNNLEEEAVPFKILSIKSGEVALNGNGKGGLKAWKLFNDRNWKAWQLAVIIATCLFAFFCISVLIVFLSNRRLTKESPAVMEERQVVVQPVIKPDVSDVNVIQPENRDCYITETDSEHTPSPCRSPLRIKGKGLLERRGSNASLTLDLNRSQENIHCGTPPKECSTEEFLLSASRSLTRNQLRNSLKDVKALHSEFWEIPMNHPERVEVAGSGTKNRYKTILPNESTRVVVRNADGDPLSCYINANYIRGYASEQKAYIATQGPMTHTVNDFWTMVWEQKCPIIVMITKLKEKLKVKCEPYVPDYQGQFAGLEVTVLKLIPRDGYTIRELLLTNGKERHYVYHVWYTAWPDHKTPNTAKQLLAMAVEVEALRHNSNGTIKGPTLVHCSAGIGRTGCFIAVSIGIQQLLEENTVDILGIVCGLRLDRGGMVQTAEQYEFVYQSLSIFETAMPDQSGE